ncbi:hypothetical protein DL767_001468 [Monosporascus sp. MG133]|nr:hypothetical protein DL767_001468 [Monosporascus sp. MG133]
MPSSQFTEADTIRVLVATDNHVGYLEDHPIRTDDAWKTFDEIMNLARKEDVDMVLLGGDLFHDHNPSRKAMFQVMRSLRKNCLGMKPCELQFLSDAGQVLGGAFNHVNYEDPDINVSIPVFSIHGNHDEPSGTGNFCSLELLEVAGLINYFGRVPEVDNIQVKPVLLQKGQTKLALYGLSNVRDERLFRSFRDKKVKWFRPNVQPKDWFNLLTVHQNHTAHTSTGYLPENVLPNWMDLVVWGHEHECLIDPRHNTETGFRVMQPGSSVATSLIKAESKAKHVAVLSITGKYSEVKKHQLKSVRPLVYREIALKDVEAFKGLEKKKENRIEVTRRLMGIVEEMIEEANSGWESLQEERLEDGERPLPLIRLKVEYTAPEGGHYDVENPQRFSQRFQDKVANTNDVVSFYRKKKLTKTEKAESIPEEALADLDLAEIKVKELVDEFLAAQSLKVLPQAPFGDAVNQFVDKGDRHIMEAFVSQTLEDQVRQMLSLEEKETEKDLEGALERFKDKLEKQFAAGALKLAKGRKLKPKPDLWDSDLEGHWEDQPQALDHRGTAEEAEPSQPRGRGRKTAKVVEEEDEDDEMNDFEETTPAPKPKGRGRPAAANAKPASAKAPAKKAAAKVPAKPPAKGRGRKAQPFEDSDDDEEEEDVVMEDDDDDPPAPPPKRAAASSRAAPARSQPTRAAAAAAAASKTRQTKLNFSQKALQQQAVEISDDEISDDDDFESIPATRSRRR